MTARLLLVLLCAVLPACSSFEAKWHAAKTPATRWDGRWTSEKHTAPGGGPAGGRLRCVLVPASGSAFMGLSQPRVEHQVFSADFHANWLWFSSDYKMFLWSKKSLNSLRPSLPVDYSGWHILPNIFGGVYRYSARIAGDHFTARYDSSYDHGTFDLTRVRP